MKKQQLEHNYPLISIIVPIYNVERYLRRCVDSILNQTYPNLEIILVNDGSPDNSHVICEDYAEKHSNVKVVKKENGGLSSARNYGLAYATGEYIGFVDSDDWISADMYSVLYNLIEGESMAVSQIGVKLTDKQESEICGDTNNKIIISGRNNILRYYLDSATRRAGEYAVWRCLFPAKLAKKYQFREGKINEDIDYKYKVLSECDKFIISDRLCYMYFQQTESLSSGVLRKRDFDLYDAANELQRLTGKEKDENIRFLGEVKSARTPFSLLCRIAYYGIDESCGTRQAIVKQLTKEHRRNIIKLLKAPLPISRKLMAIALAVNFNCLSLPISLLRKFK